jgi:hypothetical protein
VIGVLTRDSWNCDHSDQQEPADGEAVRQAEARRDEASPTADADHGYPFQFGAPAVEHPP